MHFKVANRIATFDELNKVDASIEGPLIIIIYLIQVHPKNIALKEKIMFPNKLFFNDSTLQNFFV
jgi:hypothetical protein